MNNDKLIKSLRKIKGAEREKILAEVEKIDDPQAAKMIKKEMKRYNNDPDVLYSFAEALKKINDTEGIEASNNTLIELVLAENENTRRKAALLLERLGDNIWIKAINEEPHNKERLLQMKDARECENYIKDLRSDKPGVQRKAVKYFCKATSPEASPELIKLLNQDNLAFKATEALKKRKDTYTTKLLLDAIKTGDTQIRCNAILSLSESSDLMVEKEIFELTKDSDPRVSKTAEVVISGFELAAKNDPNRMMAKFNSPTDIPALVSFINNNVGLYAMPAMDVLDKIKDPEYVDLIISVLSHQFDGVRVRAIEILGKFDNPKVVSPIYECCEKLYKATKGPTPGTAAHNRAFTMWEAAQEAAKVAYLSIKNPGIVEELAKYPSQHMGMVGVNVYLSFITDPSLVEPMIDALNKYNTYSVKHNIAIAFSKMKDPRTVGSLIKMLEDADKDIRALAAETLGEIGDKASVEPLKRVAETDKNKKVKKAAQEASGKLNNVSG